MKYYIELDLPQEIKPYDQKALAELATDLACQIKLVRDITVWPSLSLMVGDITEALAGTQCECESNHPQHIAYSGVPGVIGDNEHCERCDTCCRFETDKEATAALERHQATTYPYEVPNDQR